MWPHGLHAAAAAAKLRQSCPTLCDPLDSSPLGSRVPGILHARTLEWVAISFSYAWKWKVKVKSLSCVRLLATPWTAAYQAPPSMGFSRQEYCSGVPLPSLMDCIDPWNYPRQNTGVGSLSLLQGIFPTQGLNPGIPNCRQTLYQLSHKGSPKSLSHVQLFFNPMDRGAWRAPLSMWFPRQEYWSGLPFPFPGDLLDPGNPALLHWQTDSLPLSHQGSPTYNLLGNLSFTL